MSLKRLLDAGIKKPNPMNPLHAWKMRDALIPYTKGRALRWSQGPALMHDRIGQLRLRSAS